MLAKTSDEFSVYIRYDKIQNGYFWYLMASTSKKLAWHLENFLQMVTLKKSNKSQNFVSGTKSRASKR